MLAVLRSADQVVPVRRKSGPKDLRRIQDRRDLRSFQIQGKDASLCHPKWSGCVVEEDGASVGTPVETNEKVASRGKVPGNSTRCRYQVELCIPSGFKVQ